MFILVIIHAFFDAKENRTQRFSMLLTLFIYGFLLEYMGVISGNYDYATEPIMILGVIPLSVTFAWVGIIYSVMLIGDLLEVSTSLRILITTLIALSLDWGMDPIAVAFGGWTWSTLGQYFGVPGFNFIGWFFIPIAYLIPYGFSWNKERKKIQFLSIREIDLHNTWQRKVYSLIVVDLIAVLILMLVGIATRSPMIYNTNAIFLIIWAILTVMISTAIIIWKRKNFQRHNWHDIIPSCILMLIGLFYVFYAFLIGRPDLALLMFLTGFPIWFIFIFSIARYKS